MADEINYSLKELLVCNGARLLEDGKAVFVGTGLPMTATMLAQKTHAPQLLIVFEGGSLGPIMRELPISVADSRTFYRAIAASSMHDGICRLWFFRRSPDGYIWKHQHHCNR